MEQAMIRFRETDGVQDHGCRILSNLFHDNNRRHLINLKVVAFCLNFCDVTLVKFFKGALTTAAKYHKNNRTVQTKAENAVNELKQMVMVQYIESVTHFMNRKKQS